MNEGAVDCSVHADDEGPLLLWVKPFNQSNEHRDLEHDHEGVRGTVYIRSSGRIASTESASRFKLNGASEASVEWTLNR